jgi:hypothetical protein
LQTARSRSNRWALPASCWVCCCVDSSCCECRLPRQHQQLLCNPMHSAQGSFVHLCSMHPICTMQLSI